MLIEKLQKLDEAAAAFALGTVAAAVPLRVDVGTLPLDENYIIGTLGSYQPMAGDRVLLAALDSQRFVILGEVFDVD